jgi:hypothetical protein
MGDRYAETIISPERREALLAESRQIEDRTWKRRPSTNMRQKWFTFLIQSYSSQLTCQPTERKTWKALPHYIKNCMTKILSHRCVKNRTANVRG